MSGKQRIYWIDTLKFLGILAIYLFHLGEAGGRSYAFGFVYRVPLFFFISGCLASISTDQSSLPKFIYKQFKALMIPYFFFAAIYIFLFVIMNNSGFSLALQMARQDFLGVRNHISAPSLWFLPCLFLMEVLFRLLKTLLRNKWLILAVSVALFFFVNHFLGFVPINDPRWFWNLDSALYYLIYFASGYVAFPYLVELLKLDTPAKRAGVALAGVVAFALTGALYFQHDFIGAAFSRLGPLNTLSIVANALSAIFCNILIALVLQHWELLRRIGTNTLWLCGFEQSYKLVLSQLGTLLGISALGIQFANPLAAFLYALAILLIAPFTVIPFGKKLYYSVFPGLAPAAKPTQEQPARAV